MSDKWISVVAMLFILSLISERIATFLKLSFSDFKWFGLTDVTNAVNVPNLRRPEKDIECEKRRELGILIIAMFCGLATAALFAIDLVYIFNKTNGENIGDLIGWDNQQPDWKSRKLLAKWSGILLTGLFLSFGSKFWHDLLDLLLEVKNLRKKLSDEKSYNVERAQELVDYLEIREGDMVAAVYAENKDMLLNLPGVQGVGIGEMDVQGDSVACIAITTYPNVSEQDIPRLYYKLKNNSVKEIARRIIPAQATAVAVFLSPGSRIGNQDTVISNSSNKVNFGSFCYPVYKLIAPDKKLLLTCYHVLKHPSHKWEEFDKEFDKVVLTRSKSTQVAKMIEGKRTSELDIALAEPISGYEIDKNFPLPRTITDARWVGSRDQNVKEVEMQGAVSGHKTGIIKEYKTNVLIDYKDGSPTPFKLEKVFSIATRDDKAIAKPGDSGSLIIDKEGYALGLVVATNDKRTYAIQMMEILKQLNLDLK